MCPSLCLREDAFAIWWHRKPRWHLDASLVFDTTPRVSYESTRRQRWDPKSGLNLLRKDNAVGASGVVSDDLLRTRRSDVGECASEVGVVRQRHTEGALGAFKNRLPARNHERAEYDRHSFGVLDRISIPLRVHPDVPAQPEDVLPFGCIQTNEVADGRPIALIDLDLVV